MVLVWGTDNAAPDTVRAVTTAIIPGVGALGSVIAFVRQFLDAITLMQLQRLDVLAY